MVSPQVRDRKLSQRPTISKNVYYKNLQQKHYILLLCFSPERYDPHTVLFWEPCKPYQTALCAFIRLENTTILENQVHALYKVYLNLIFKTRVF